MKDQTTLNDTSGIFLTAAIFLANMDYMGLLDYAVRAIVGGSIWMLFKIATDYLSAKAKKEKQKKEEAKNERVD